MKFFNFKLLASRTFHLTYAVIRYFMFEKKPSGSSRISLKWKYLQMESNSGKLCSLILDYIDIKEIIKITIATTIYPKKNKAISKKEEYLTKDIVYTGDICSRCICLFQTLKWL